MGTIVDGNANLTAGTQDYKSWQLVDEDGVTPISLAGITSITLLFINRDDGTTKSFINTGASPKLFITDAVNGKIQLRPAVTDFPVKASFLFYVEIIDSIGVHAVPEGKRYIFTVIDKIS